ncbi:MAG: Spy/CpxP family protein refolding chaperone [Gemmatimonadaceae bacterium]|nr:Spy/CpxP family protein refolding chaperone [Gemmatimonadaceae bacterium]
MLRRHTLFLAAVVAVAACDQTPTDFRRFDEAGLASVEPSYLIDTTTATSGFGRGPGGGPMGAPRAVLPDSLKLTDAQKAQMTAIRTAFETANATNLAALKAIHTEARAAVQAGKTRDEVRAILEKGKTIRDTMKPAFEAMHAAMQAVLTPAQKAWLDANRPPKPPRPPLGRP